MLTINDLKPKMIVMIDGWPYQLLEVAHQHLGRGGASVRATIRNLLTGQVLARAFKPADTFAEAEIDKRTLNFLYAHRGTYAFADPENPRERFTLPAEKIGNSRQWLKPQTPVTAVFLEGKILEVLLPVKVDLEVAEAPPGLKGDTAAGGAKTVTLETGAKVTVPLFIAAGDVIRVNTETGEYVERVSKA